MAKKADILTHENIIRVQGWARDGLTLEEIATNLDIALSTLCKWKNEEKELSEALKKGQDVADREVENALYKAAVEGNTTAMIFWLKNRKPDKWRDGKSLELAGQVDTTSNVPNKLVFVGTFDEKGVTNPAYLAAMRWKNKNMDAAFKAWKENHLQEYDELVAACDAEIKARKDEKDAG